MVETSGRILKSKDVIIDGQYFLDLKKIGVAEAKPQGKETISVPARVCILENHAEYAVLEVTCACGTSVCLRCEYGNAQTPNPSQTQNGTTVEPNETK